MSDILQLASQFCVIAWAALIVVGVLAMALIVMGTERDPYDDIEQAAYLRAYREHAAAKKQDGVTRPAANGRPHDRSTGVSDEGTDRRGVPPLHSN